MKASPSPLWRFARRRGRAIGLWCVLAYVIAATGAIPIPQIGRWLARLDPAAEAYPCQGHACGCHTAAECLDHCCCFTPAERLAWAKAQKLTTVAAALEKVCEESKAAEASQGRRSCCSGHEETGEDERAVASREAPAAPVSAPARKGQEGAPGAASGWGFQLSPLGCKSVDSWLLVAIPFSDLLSGRASLPPPRLLTVRRAPDGRAAPRRILDVPVPPPRG